MIITEYGSYMWRTLAPGNGCLGGYRGWWNICIMIYMSSCNLLYFSFHKGFLAGSWSFIFLGGEFALELSIFVIFSNWIYNLISQYMENHGFKNVKRSWELGVADWILSMIYNFLVWFSVVSKNFIWTSYSLFSNSCILLVLLYHTPRPMPMYWLSCILLSV